MTTSNKKTGVAHIHFGRWNKILIDETDDSQRFKVYAITSGHSFLTSDEYVIHLEIFEFSNPWVISRF